MLKILLIKWLGVNTSSVHFSPFSAIILKEQE